MVCPFVDRDSEIGVLRKAYEGRPSLVVAYGRRRVGKSRLLREFVSRLAGKVVYYTAAPSSHSVNLRQMAEQAASVLGPELGLGSWGSADSLLRVIHRLGAEVVVIDEFTFWVRAYPGVVGEIQRFVDEYLPGTSMVLALSGSLVGVMEGRVLGGGAPLFGRASVVLKLGPLSFSHLKYFLPGMMPEDRVRVYALVGGIPHYLCMLRGSTSLREVVEALIRPGSPLLTEKELTLSMEVREPHTYYSILSAIARGYDTLTRIAQYAGIPVSHVSKYLSVLEFLGVVRRDVPLFGKRGRYVISDAPLRTVFTLLEPLRSLIELEQWGRVREAVTKRIDSYTSRAWEDLVRKHLLETHAEQGYTVVGRLVHKGIEVDAAVVNPETREVIVAEAKWSTLSSSEAGKLRRDALVKAAKIVPRGYVVRDAYVYARGVEGVERPEWLITPADMG